MARKPTPEVLEKAAKLVASTFDSYQERMMKRKSELLRVYDEYSTFEEERTSEWATSFKVNKAHEVVENVLPSLTAKDPRWVVSVRDLNAFQTPESVQDIEEESPLKGMTPEVMAEKEPSAQKQAEVVQDYLTYLFEEYNLMDTIELWAKNGVVDGKGYARVTYKYEKTFRKKMEYQKDENGDVILNEYDEPELVDETEEVIAGEYPTIEIIDWADLWYDARYIEGKDRPAWIQAKENVRFADLERYKDRYINLDRVKELIGKSNAHRNNKDGFKESIKSIQGINLDKAAPVDESSLTLNYYYGYFNETESPEKEAYYEIVTVDNMLVIRVEKIAQCPIEEWKCFPDPKSGHAVGFVEPILGIQREMNYKKNAASEHINRGVRQQRIWSEMSGIDPYTINDPIITTSRTGQEALANIPELTFNNINPAYFQEQNDLERQIQGLTHTVDVSNPRSQQALTNTATGAKIKFFESNKVLDAVRKRWERALERLAYKLLACSFENMEDNIVFKKMGSEGYWYANKEILRDAINKYRIKIEVNSSAATDVESRRDEVLGFASFAAQMDAQLAAMQSPKRIDFMEIFKDGAMTFEKKDPERYISGGEQNTQQLVDQVMQKSGGRIPMPEEKGTNAEELTKQVTGNILTQ